MLYKFRNIKPLVSKFGVRVMFYGVQEENKPRRSSTDAIYIY
jgi:hypothetical protein